MKYSKCMFFLFFIFLLPFSGCKEANHEFYNPYTIAEEPIVEENLNQIASGHSIVLFGLLSKVTLGMISNPLLYNLTGELPAELRTGCPCISFSDPIGTFPNTLTATFDNCEAGAIYDHTYDGVVTIVVNAPMNSSASGGGAELTISTTDFTFTNSDATQSFDINTSAPISLNWVDNSYYEINYEINLGGDVTITEGSNVTTYFSGTQITLGIVPNSNDNTNDPSTYIDNTLEFTATSAGSPGGNTNGRLINCSNGVSSQNLCIGPYELAITPFSCGCPQYGVLFFINVINNNSCGNNQVLPQIRFGWSSNDPCDNLDINGNVITACGS